MRSALAQPRNKTGETVRQADGCPQATNYIKEFSWMTFRP